MKSLMLASLAMLLGGHALAQNDFELPKITRPTVQEPASQGEGTDFQQILSGKSLQQSYALKELSADWKRVSIQTASGPSGGADDLTGRIMQAAMLPASGPRGKDDAVSAALGLSMLGGLFAGAREPIYYTKGQTVTISGDTFLVAYAPDRAANSLLEATMQARASGREPDVLQIAAASKLTPDSRVTLTLINTKSIESLGKIRPFNLDAEIADSARPAASLIDWLTIRSSTAQQVPPPAQAVAKPSTRAKSAAPQATSRPRRKPK